MAPILSSIASIIKQYGISGAPSGPVFVPATVTGGTTIIDGTEQYNVFLSSGSLVVSNGTISVKVLVIAGGGGGGAYAYGGGGGAGGVLYGVDISLSPGTYPLVIGAGGPGAVPNGPAPPGSNSSFNGNTANGGGGGGTWSTHGDGKPGGSGGGSSYYKTTVGAATQTPVGSYTGYGNPS